VSARKTRVSRLAVAVALAGALGGCNLIVGSGDYVVGDAAVAGGDASAAGPDGSLDDAATTHPESGTTVDSGSTPDAGGDTPDGAFVFEGGVPLEAGSAVSCSSSGALVLGSQATSADFQKLVDSCVLAVNCDPGLFAVTVSDCITDNYLQAVGSVACLATITDCDGYYGCQGRRVATQAECQGKGTTGFCTGNVATTCDGTPYIGSVQNCDKLGGTCATHLSGSDVVAECVVVPSCADAGTNNDSTNHCAGNKVYECIDGAGYGEDCAAINSTCADRGDINGALCYFNASACSASGSRCSGGVFTSCSSDNTQQFDYQCTRAGLSCVDNASDVACVAPGCAPPSTSKCTESCGADTITAEVCVGGAPYPIDCSQHGFSRCIFDSADGYAFCVH